MRITSIVFYRRSLLIPYLALVIMFPFLRFGVEPSSDVLNHQAGPTFIPQVIDYGVRFLEAYLALMSWVYVLGALYWLLPYTVLIIILWIWSIKKTKSQIYKIYIWSPVYLGLLLPVVNTVIDYYTKFSGYNILSSGAIPATLICLFPASIVFGYLLIGMTAWVYDFLRRRGIVVDEEIQLNLEDVRN